MSYVMADFTEEPPRLYGVTQAKARQLKAGLFFAPPEKRRAGCWYLNALKQPVLWGEDGPALAMTEADNKGLATWFGNVGPALSGIFNKE